MNKGRRQNKRVERN